MPVAPSPLLVDVVVAFVVIATVLVVIVLVVVGFVTQLATFPCAREPYNANDAATTNNRTVVQQHNTTNQPLPPQ